MTGGGTWHYTVETGPPEPQSKGRRSASIPRRLAFFKERLDSLVRVFQTRNAGPKALEPLRSPPEGLSVHRFICGASLVNCSATGERFQHFVGEVTRRAHDLASLKTREDNAPSKRFFGIHPSTG